VTDRMDPERDALCGDAPADIEDLLDGRLDEEAAAALRAHIEVCGSCREDLAAEKELRRLLRTECGAQAPEGFADGVMAQVRGTAAPRRRLLFLPAVAAAAAVLILAVLAGLDRQDGTVDEPGPEPVLVADVIPAMPASPEPEGSALARDLARRARLFLAVAEQTSPEILAQELRLSGLGEALACVDFDGLETADRDAVRRVSLLEQAWRNGAPVARSEVAMLVGGVR
jgi:mycothiol system anti-sigma-R factor